MNKFDEKYDIRLAHYDEIDEIMSFIDQYWKKDHILARNREYFEYEMVVDGQVNFIIARDRDTGKISGIHGFQLASKSKDKLDIWGSIWKVAPGSMGFLGIEIVRRAGALTGTRNFLSNGGNPNTTVPINRKILKLSEVGKMQHYYCLSYREEYKIAKVNRYIPFKENTDYQVEVFSIPDYDEIKKHFDFTTCEKNTPFKDAWYIKHRFYDHPIYKYEVYGMRDDSDKEMIDALLVCREQECNDSKVLRIVDCIGKINLIGGISSFLANKLKEYEFVDLYCFGIDDGIVRQSGMVEINDGDANIIPNYFNPYVAENIDIWIGTPAGKAVFFRADGDQDRPS